MWVWMMRLYPPLFFSRIWIQVFSEDFNYLKVKITRSIFNRNLNGSIFGGTLFSAADPFFAMMFWQIFQKKGIKTMAWLRNAKIQYHTPAMENVFLEFNIDAETIKEAELGLLTNGKYSKYLKVEAKTKTGILICSIETEIYLKKIN